MSQEAVGRRYALAIFELAKEDGSLSATSTQVTDFATCYRESLELRDVLDNPLVPEPQRVAVLVDIATRLGASGTVKRALRVIFRARRLRALPDIASRLATLVDEEQKVLRAQVTSATPLGESYLTRLRAQLEQATGRKVVLATDVDPSLIAGIVTKIGDRIVDGSLRHRLDTFARAAELT